MQIHPLEVSPFESRETQRRKDPARTGLHRVYRFQKKKSSSRPRATGMWVKIGVCTLALALVVMIELFLFKDNAVETGAAGETAPPGSEEILGRLQFVQADGVMSVFSGSQRWSPPVAAVAVEALEEARVIRFTADRESPVSLPAAGEVAEIGEDETYGGFVRVHHGSGLESIYYNLAEVRVEVGQPLLALDTLGEVGESGDVFVAVLQSGVAMQPDAYIDVLIGN